MLFIFIVFCFLEDVFVVHFVYFVPDTLLFYIYYILHILLLFHLYSSVKCLSNSILGVEVGPKSFPLNCSSNGFCKASWK